MTPSLLRVKVIAERSAWIKEMLNSLKTLPLKSMEDFLTDSRNVAAAESYLRRALEALFDLGRHILGKGFGQAISEYKEISSQELYEILTHDLKDIENLLSVILKWIQQHPEMVDQEL